MSAAYEKLKKALDRARTEEEVAAAVYRYQDDLNEEEKALVPALAETTVMSLTVKGRG